MSTRPSNQQIFEWHMQHLRNAAMPMNTTHAIQPTSCPVMTVENHTSFQQIPYMANDPRFDYYSYKADNFNTPLPQSNLAQSQTFDGFSIYDYNFDEPTTPASATAMEDASVFDEYDNASCYSETPSSFFSSDHTDRSGRESVFSAGHARYPPSVTSHWERPAQPMQDQHTSQVDALMRAIKPPSLSPPTSTAPSLHLPTEPVSATSSNGRPKKHFCPYNDCNKSFSQPTHLKIHLRSHTGEKPYTCSIPSCRQAFSQLGNLRTHERRHTGQRPNRRKRASSDPGSRGKRYECILDNCRIRTPHAEAGEMLIRGKVFTQLGNLKAHMNKFHKETLERLGDRFTTCSKEDEELKAYFTGLFKNSNKGIKGRGKGRKVEVIVAKPSFDSTLI